MVMEDIKYEEMQYVVWMLYTIVGVGLIAFIVWVLPSLVMSTYDALYSALDRLILEIKEHFDFLEREKGRHRKMNFEQWFHEAVIEFREVNEGKRMPVSISG